MSAIERCGVTRRPGAQALEEALVLTELLITRADLHDELWQHS